MSNLIPELSFKDIERGDSSSISLLKDALEYLAKQNKSFEEASEKTKSKEFKSDLIVRESLRSL